MQKLLLIIATAVYMQICNAQPSFINNGETLGNVRVWNIVFGDVNGDTYLDALVATMDANFNSTTKLWLNDGTGHFTVSTQNLGNGQKSVALADLDGDKDNDAIVGNVIWINDGKGNFKSNAQQLGNKQTLGVALADFDSDGDLDAYVCNHPNNNNPPTNGENQIWFNDGTGKFTIGQTFLNGYHYKAQAGDLDGDGDLDVMVATGSNWTGAANENEIWINDGKGQFTKKVLSTTCATDLALSDFDNDGDLDVVITYDLDPNDIKGAEIYMNDGKGNFSLSSQKFDNIDCFGVSVGDVDNDGDWDIILANGNWGNDLPNKIWLNDRKGNFTKSNISFGSGDGVFVKFVDVNNDGKLDVVAGNKIWLNNTISTSIIKEKTDNSSIHIYPNPTSGVVTIKGSNIVEVNVYDIFGKLLLKQDSNSQKTVIDLSGYNGICLLKTTTILGSAITKVIVK